MNPLQATLAILHGIVADAVTCARAPWVSDTAVRDLAAVRQEVGLPIADLTPGMRYAIENYERDGWGRDFRLVTEKVDRYRIVSSGQDGVFETEDDLSVAVHSANPYIWPRKLHALFLRQQGAELVTYYHQYIEDDSEVRATISGPRLFGRADRAFGKREREILRSRFRKVVGETGKDSLVLMAYDIKDMRRFHQDSVL